LGYAYMMPEVEKADLTIASEIDNNGRPPSVTYHLMLARALGRRYAALTGAIQKKGLWSKLKVLYLLWRGTPYPGTYENQLTQLARSYLPSNYEVKIHVR
jgi:hypothetical protein